MNQEPLLLTILFGIAATAAIGALNSRETVRLVLSSLLAIMTLGAAVYHTSRYLALSETVVEIPPPAPLPPPPPPAPVPKAPPETVMVKPDTAGLGASHRDAAIAQAKGQLRVILAQVLRLQRSLSSFDLSRVADVSDEEYQSMQGRASGYASEGKRIKDKLSEVIMRLPPGMEETALSFDSAMDALIAAARNLERFFKSENDNEERDRKAAFSSGLQNASSALRKLEIRLGSGDAP